jgi:hypothetical protein
VSRKPQSNYPIFNLVFIYSALFLLFRQRDYILLARLIVAYSDVLVQTTCYERDGDRAAVGTRDHLIHTYSVKIPKHKVLGRLAGPPL